MVEITFRFCGKGAYGYGNEDGDPAMASPLVALADDTLLATAHHPVISSSAVGAVLLIEALVTSLMVSRTEHVQQAGKLTEAIAAYLFNPGGRSR